MIWLRLGRSGIALLLGAILTGLVFSALSPTPSARAAGTTRYVTVDGVDDTDCSSPSSPCRTPQYAIVEAGAGDVVKIAAGTYDSVSLIAFTTTVPYSFTQIAYISKTLTVSGGYTVSNWVTADAVANPTVFDAGGAGRGVTIFGTGTEVVTLTGLTLTGGDYTGLGNPNGVFLRNCRGYQSDCGGGVYAVRVQLQASDL
ncbi:MAG: hypothetical protein JNL73_24540, partial [Anaerolineales bacterium]|nr:hypothetical protein [Anaerolineales bacterium]